MAAMLKIGKHLGKIVKKEYIALNVHMPNFKYRPQCRLITSLPKKSKIKQ